MCRITIRLIVAAALLLFASQSVQARGFGGAHGGGGYSSGGYHSSGYHEGGSHSSGYHEGGASGGYHGGGYSSGGYHEGGSEHSAAEGAAAGHAATDRNAPQYSGAEGAAAGHAATKNKQPQYSGAEGAAAGHAAAENKQPQYSGAQGAAAGAAASNRNTYPAAAHAALPTDAGYGMPAARTGAAAYAGYHHTAAVSGSVAAARGAAVRNSYNGYGMYGHGWYAANPRAWAPTGWAAGQAWRAAAWPTVGASLGWDTTEPVPYDYGTNITYQDDQVYQGDQPVATADQYYQQAATLAQSAAAPDPSASDWTPLGVFALVENDQSEPHYVMQLAINNSGTLGGNYSDLIGGTTLPIQGAVDKKTQRVAWTVGNNKNTVGEAGLYNLTQDEAPALIHIGKNKTQQWLLVRLKQPEQPGGEK